MLDTLLGGICVQMDMIESQSCWLYIHDVILLFHYTTSQRHPWIKNRSLWRPFKHSEVSDLLKKPAADGVSSVPQLDGATGRWTTWSDRGEQTGIELI